MIILASGMLNALAKHRKHLLFANILPAKLAIQIFGALCVLVSICQVFISCHRISDVKDRESDLSAEEIATRKLGKYIAANYAGKKTLIIKTPTSRIINKKAEEGRLRGLKNGLNGKIDDIIEASPVVPANTLRFGEKWYTAKKFDQLAHLYADREVIISMIGLPDDLDDLLFWQKPTKPALILYRGHIRNLDAAIWHKHVQALLIPRPDMQLRGRKSRPSNRKSFFNKYFLLIDKNNVKKIKKSYPTLFR